VSSFYSADRMVARFSGHKLASFIERRGVRVPSSSSGGRANFFLLLPGLLSLLLSGSLSLTQNGRRTLWQYSTNTTTRRAPLHLKVVQNWKAKGKLEGFACARGARLAAAWKASADLLALTQNRCCTCAMLPRGSPT